MPGAEGISIVKTRQPLGDYPARLTDKLIHWATVDPDRTYMARRDKDGQWRRISYGEALQSARRIGQALLQHVHRIPGAERLGFVFQVATGVDVVEVVGEHQAEVGQRRLQAAGAAESRGTR